MGRKESNQTKLVLSADKLWKELGPGSGQTKCWHDLDPNCLTLMVFLKEYFEKDDFEKISRQVWESPSSNTCYFVYVGFCHMLSCRCIVHLYSRMTF